MSEPSFPPSADRVFGVKYHDFLQQARNQDLHGAGHLRISERNGEVRFSGKNRGLFGKKIQVSLEASEIWDLQRKGKRIQFRATSGKAVRKGMPFVFYAESDDAAEEIFQLLPKQQSREGRNATIDQLILAENCPPHAPAASPTIWIMAANGIAFVVSVLFFGAELFDPTDLTPYITLGANNGAYTTSGEWWRLVASMFLHFGLIHLLLNMWALYAAGQLLERLQGRALFLVTYFGAGLIGSLASIFWYGDEVWSAGASGAVFGVYGALLAFSLKVGKNFGQSIFQPLRNSTFGFVGYNLIFGMIHPGIDNACHIGGFIGGALLGYLGFISLEKEQREAALMKKLPGVALTLVALIALSLPLLPKFNYLPAEHEAFVAQVLELGEAEDAVYEAERANINRLFLPAMSEEEVPSVAPVRERLLPLYDSWIQRFEETPYSAESSTEQNRQLILAYLRERRDAWDDLASTIESGEGPDLEEFTARTQTAHALLAELQ
jgi:rhomboid protease GluP